jgi:phospholipase/carboxylesterase
MFSLTTHTLPPATGAKPDSAIIILHGLGDRGDGGLLDIGRVWQRDFPTAVILCPDAPHPFDMAPVDFGGRQWFGLQQHDAASMLAGAERAAPILNTYLDEVMAHYSLAPTQVALVGFSQGCMMSLYVAPRRSQALGGVIGYSGSLLGGQSLTQDKKSSPPVLLVHGMEDDVVPFAAMRLAEQGLRAAGFTVTSLAVPRLGHGIDNTGLDAGSQFLHHIWPN